MSEWSDSEEPARSMRRDSLCGWEQGLGLEVTESGDALDASVFLWCSSRAVTSSPSPDSSSGKICDTGKSTSFCGRMQPSFWAMLWITGWPRSLSSGSPKSQDWPLRTMAYSLCTVAIRANCVFSRTSAYPRGSCLYSVFFLVPAVQTNPSSLHRLHGNSPSHYNTSDKVSMSKNHIE